jgi:hypothetical protein
MHSFPQLKSKVIIELLLHDGFKRQYSRQATIATILQALVIDPAASSVLAEF